MVVVSLNCGCGFLEADVIKSSKRRTTDVFDCVIRYKELLLKRWEDRVKYSQNAFYT